MINHGVSGKEIRPDALANRISDDTTKFGMNDLLAGTRAFLKYGKDKANK